MSPAGHRLYRSNINLKELVKLKTMPVSCFHVDLTAYMHNYILPHKTAFRFLPPQASANYKINVLKYETYVIITPTLLLLAEM